MNKNFISTKKLYIAPTAKFITVETQHLMDGASGNTEDPYGGGSIPTPVKEGVLFIDDNDFMDYE